MRKIKLLLPLALLLVLNQVNAQTREIKGSVTDSIGTPLLGATVQVKNSNVATKTNENGLFSIHVPSDNSNLIISSVGYQAQTISVGNSDNISVVLRPSVQNALQEVVIVGYGTQRRANLVASVSTVKAADIEDRPYASVDQMLQGKVPGLQAPQFSGQPGAAQSIRIRGIGSASAGADPLYVVDGIIINAGDLSSNTTTANTLAGVNPNDIESVTVLKDAQATSIYGSRGANGVILISTKKGRAGKTQIRADVEIGQNRVADLPDNARFLNTNEWLGLLREGVINAGGAQEDADFIAKYYGEGSGINTNWLDLITRHGNQQQYNLSASGGDSKNQFYVSGGYFNQQGTVIASDFKRYSFRTNYKHIVNDKLNFSVLMTGSNSTEHAPTNGGLFSNPVGALPFLRPTQNPYNPDGSLNISTTGATNFNSGNYNPLYIAQNDINRLNTTLLQGSIGAEYSILKNLRFSSRFGIDFNLLEEYNFLNQFHGDGAGNGGIGIPINSRFFNWISTNQFDYNTSFGKEDKFRLSALVGYEAQKNKAYVVTQTSQGFPPNNTLYLSVNASTPTAATATGSDYDIAGLYTSANISYNNRFVVSASFRRDGSSRFSENNRYGNFWSAGAAWNLDHESFISDLPFITALKLRGSYGTTGNAAIGNYVWRPAVHFGTAIASSLADGGANYAGQPGGVYDVLGNLNLTWESTDQGDVGLDASFLKDRVSFTLDFYRRVSDKLLFNNPLSATTGFTSFVDNIGKIENKGYEITVNGTPVKTKNFFWSLSFNLSHNKNTVLTLPEGKDIPVAGTQFRLSQGHDFQTYYAREWAGVNPDNGDPLWYVDGTHKETTSDYNTAKRQFLGSASPKYFGGLTSIFNYRGIDLQADFVYNYGNYVTDGWIYYAIDGAYPDLNKYAINLQRWQKPGDKTNVPRYEYGSSNNSNAFSSRFLYKGDFIRLRNVTLGYNLNDRLLKRIGITSLRVYVRGTNLWTKTYDNNLTIDPEQGISSSSNLNVFYTKSLTAGINLVL